MNPIQKTLLTIAFEALGPERVTRGLEATGHTWRDCFLALAVYGEPDALARHLTSAGAGSTSSAPSWAYGYTR